LKTLPDEVLTFETEPDPKSKIGPTYLLICLKGDVTADHVVEEDTHAPDGGLFTIVPVGADPFWGSVHSSS
jgi:hypothetical protein